MTSISKEQCIEFAQLFELNLHHWRLLTGITSSKDESFIYSKEGIFPVQYTDEELSKLTPCEQFEIGEFCTTEPLLFPCLPSELLHFIDNLALGDFNVPEDFRKAVEQSMCGPEHSGTDSLIDWYNNTLSASIWFGLQSVAPKEAAMLLCRFNPHDNRLDPLECWNPETGTADYKRLLRVFEDESLPRTLMQWIAIAQDNELKYHSWIDEYVNAARLERIDAEPTAPIVQNKGGEREVLRCSALLREFRTTWPSIERDIRDKTRHSNPRLNDANFKHGYYDVEMALKWAKEEGKISKTSAVNYTKTTSNSVLSYLIGQIYNLN